MRKLLSRVILGASIVAAAPVAYAQKSSVLPAPTIRPAIDGILTAFASHPIVALGNSEGNAQEEDFYSALVRDPRFAREVGNVVVEFGGAADQGFLDRYLNGEEVSFPDLRKVWSDVVGYNFPADMGVVNFFVQVREVNRALPPAQRIHVWLGEPPIDWSKIKSNADSHLFGDAMQQRDTYPAAIIEEKILAAGKKALVIYGAGHFYQRDPGDMFFPVIPLVEKKHPNSVFKVQMYYGFLRKSCTDKFEKAAASWPTPALATPIRGTALEGRLYSPTCDVVPRTSWGFGPSTSEADKSHMIEQNEKMVAGVKADALLYLGKSATLTQSPLEPSIYLDPDYRREMNRRATLGLNFSVGTAPLTDALVQSNPAAPQFIHKNDLPKKAAESDFMIIQESPSAKK